MEFPGRKSLPRLEDLPLSKGDPPFSAWGLWENAKLGSLNYLTDEFVLAAARENIQTGARVGLKCGNPTPHSLIDEPMADLAVFLSILLCQHWQVGRDSQSIFTTRRLG